MNTETPSAPAPSQPLIWRTVSLCAAAASLALIAALIWTSLTRGPWYDEFYTQYVTRPDVPFVEALTSSWLPDNHPPLYYLLARATAWLGTIEMHRLLNVGIAGLALAAGAAITRDVPRLQVPACLVIVLLAGHLFTIYMGSELRSYFLSLCCGALLALALMATWITRSAGSRGRRIATMLVALAAFDTHIISTVTSGALVATFALAAAVRRDWKLLFALAAAPAVAAALFLAVTALQVGHWFGNTAVFWIPAGFDAARWAIQYAVQRVAEANPVLTLTGLGGIVVLSREALRVRRSPELEAIVLIGIGTAIAIAALIGLHLFRPVIIEKYLMVMAGAMATGLALAAARAFESLPRRAAVALIVLALVFSLVALTANAGRIADARSWYGTGRFLAAQLRRCPTSAIHLDPHWNAEVMAMSPADNRRVPGFGYATVASRFGLRPEPPSSRRVPIECPALFWAEHDTKREFDPATIFRHVRAQGYAVDRLIQYRIGDGWVASDRPLPGVRVR